MFKQYAYIIYYKLNKVFLSSHINLSFHIILNLWFLNFVCVSHSKLALINSIQSINSLVALVSLHFGALN